MMAYSAVSDTISITVNEEVVTNESPVVDAGQDQSITLPANEIHLNPGVSDDGLPEESSLDVEWTPYFHKSCSFSVKIN